MVAKPLRTKPKSASAERCLRSLGATIDMATPDMETSNCPVRGVLSHGGLRKGNQEVAVITGFYRSPGIAGEHALLAEYHCHYDLREGKVKDIRVSQFYPRPFASRQEQGSLIERNPLESMVVYRPKSLRRQAALPLQAEQLWLFARVRIG